MNFLKYAFVTVCSLAVFSSCMSEKEQLETIHFDNKLFLSVNQVSEDILVKPGAKDITRTISMATALPVDEDITAVVAPDMTLVKQFRSEFGINAQPLPTDNCCIDNPRLTIRKGAVASASTTIEFIDLGDLDGDEVYVLPVAIKHVNGIDVLKSKQHYYYVFKGAALVNVVCNFTDNRAGAKEWKTPQKFTNMSTFTCEALVRQNKAPNMISTIMGVENHYLLRIGDAGVPATQLQIASSTNQTNNKMTFPAGKWVHVACVFDNGKTTVYFDGKKVLDAASSGRTSVTWPAYGDDPKEQNNARYFWLGYSYSSDRYLDGEMCEVRVWDHCLTEEEINATNHFYTIDPASEGLIAYWKMDEGDGQVLKDSSPNGNDLTLDKATRWPKVSLPEK